MQYLVNFCGATFIAKFSHIIFVALSWTICATGVADSCEDAGYLHSRLCETWNDRDASGLVPHIAPLQVAKTAAELPPLEAEAGARHLGGQHGMIAQWTPNRARKRALNQKSLTSTILPFDDDKFHFGKVSKDEVLMCFNPRQETECRHTATSNTCHLPSYASMLSPGAGCDTDSTEPAVVIINVHPVCRHHIIVVPDISEKQPQVLSFEALMVGLAFSSRASSRMWLSFNSIGAGASVNHLHWQGFFPAAEPDTLFPLDAYLSSKGKIRIAPRRGPISLWVTDNWPLRGWIFTWDDLEVLKIDSGLAELRLTEYVHKFIAKLQHFDMAHNVLVSASGTRVMVFPRKVLNQQGEDVSRLQVAGHEILGWWILPRRDDFDTISAESAAAHLSAAALDERGERHVANALRELGWQVADDLPEISMAV